MSRRPPRWASAGFTLAELAIVVLIMGLLLGLFLPPLSSQVQQQRTSDTQRLVVEVRESLIGYAAANGRLPCPAAPTSAGQESFALGGSSANGNCSNFYDGFVPGVTLGLAPTDDQGFIVDSWGNRIRYAVTPSDAHSFTKTNGMKNTTIQSLDPDLRVCSSSTGIAAGQCASPETSNVLTKSAVAVVLSVGANGASASHGTDEAANLDADRIFVYHTPTPASAANGEFDDIVTWLSANILYNRMIAAGQLP